jgi:hypothetical protein
MVSNHQPVYSQNYLGANGWFMSSPQRYILNISPVCEDMNQPFARIQLDFESK